MTSSEKKQQSARKEEIPEEILKHLIPYKQKLKAFSLAALIEEFDLYRGERHRPLNALCYQAILDEIDLRDRKLNILWKRSQEFDMLTTAPFKFHGDKCICKECWED